MFIVFNPDTCRNITSFDNEQDAANFCKGTPFEVFPA